MTGVKIGGIASQRMSRDEVGMKLQTKDRAMLLHRVEISIVMVEMPQFTGKMEINADESRRGRRRNPNVVDLEIAGSSDGEPGEASSVGSRSH